MKHFDPIKDKLREAEGLPADLSWEKMKDGIYSKMDGSDLNNVEGENRKKYLFLLLFIFIGSASYFLLKSLKDPSKPLIQEEVLTTNIQKPQNPTAEQQSNLRISDNSLETNTETSFDSKQRNNADTNEKQALLRADISVSSQKSKFKKHNSEILKDPIDPENVKLRSDVQVQQHTAPLNEAPQSTRVNDLVSENNPNLKVTSNGFDKTKSSINPFPSFQSLSPLNRLTLSNLPIKDRTIGIDSPTYVELGSQKKISPSSKINWSLSFGSGLNFMDSNYGNSTLGNALSEIESHSLGYSASLRIDADRGNWFLSSGLEWKSAYRLTETTVINTLEEEHEVLVQVIHNPFSGTQEIHENRLVDIIDTTSFKHHNQFKSWSIPMVIGHYKDCHSFYHKIGIGANFTFAQSQNGITVRDNRHLIYNESNELFNSNLGFSLLGELEIGYVLKSKINIGFRMNYNHTLTNLSQNESLNMRPKIFNSEFILGYRF